MTMREEQPECKQTSANFYSLGFSALFIVEVPTTVLLIVRCFENNRGRELICHQNIQINNYL